MPPTQFLFLLTADCRLLLIFFDEHIIKTTYEMYKMEKMSHAIDSKQSERFDKMMLDTQE